jgi:hypothetical protein
MEVDDDVCVIGHECVQLCGGGDVVKFVRHADVWLRVQRRQREARNGV